ncbi:MAG: metallopeptidase TldD-related protein [Armatimonadota bacterium]|nr:metallopeptidase TldD-related protein [Armatimonadota bacterium]MDR7451608.1 metallopeptidase TldD-related protein [Armatimonadota bacterium]MDR7467672.1 metallopeptidase TldD-related protein [Armatimonadota bacterium]MDR7492577.1 metallopeptidase TldD-related protein [Armatimonadota bacterium]MDR7499955.1 metallopeptidase TldD-related protein [Armatimonadota bacterium]
MTPEEARRYVLARARERGVAAEVLAELGRELTARAHQRRLEQLTQAVRGGVGVRVVVAGRTGYAYSEELTPEALDWMLQEAIDNAGLQSETGGFLPAGRATPHRNLVGQALQGSLEAKIQMAIGLESTIREDARVKQVLYASYAEREWEVAVASTEGAEGSYRRGVAGLIASLVMQDGASRKQGFDDEWATGVAALEPGRTALEMTERTGRLLGAKPLPTGKYRAYLEPKAAAALLAAFSPMWNGKQVAEGKSPLAGRLGEAIASPLLTLIDDPLLPDGLASRPVDAEGTPAQKTVLVQSGVLTSYLTNSETARTLGLQNTGHAWRTYRGILGVAPSNLYVAPGQGVTLADGVIVSEVMGVHAGTNPITGEFSVQALGLRVEDGAIAYPVENFAIAGSFLALMRQITALGSELKWEYAGRIAYGVPMIEVSELTFAGA